MKKQNFSNIAKKVIDLEIKALQILKKNINKPFNDAVFQIAFAPGCYHTSLGVAFGPTPNFKGLARPVVREGRSDLERGDNTIDHCPPDLDQTHDHSQAQASAGKLCGIEGIEYLVQFRFDNTAPCI